MKIVACAGSNSLNSINKALVSYALDQANATEKLLLDLNDYPLPLYSIDLECSTGIPQEAHNFLAHLETADLLIISLAEHNGSYTAAFKNTFDWISRIKTKCFENKRMILLSTSPGARGGRGVMDAALVRFPIHGAEILGHFCLPKFNENFDAQKGIVDGNLKQAFQEVLNTAF